VRSRDVNQVLEQEAETSEIARGMRRISRLCGTASRCNERWRTIGVETNLIGPRRGSW